MPIKTSLVENMILKGIEERKIPGLVDQRLEVKVDAENGVVYMERNKNFAVGGIPETYRKFMKENGIGYSGVPDFFIMATANGISITKIGGTTFTKRDGEFTTKKFGEVDPSPREIAEMMRMLKEIREVVDGRFFKRLQQ